MEIALWVVQVILGIKLITVTWTHGPGRARPNMQAAIDKLGRAARPLLHGVAALAFIGTLGLILPGLIGASAWITVITAALLALMLLFSLFFHFRSREKPKVFVSLVLFVFAVFIATGHWALMRW
jgi:hypothetical protein